MSEVKTRILRYLSEMLEELMDREQKISKGIQKCCVEMNEIQRDVCAMQQRQDINKDFFSVVDSFSEECHDDYLKRAEDLSKKIEILQKELGKLYEKIDQIKEIKKYIMAFENEEVTESKKEDEFKLEILETQEMERKRISMDLHDTVVQNLTTLIHKTELVTKLVDMDVVRAKLELQTMLSTIRSSINELRGVIYNLRPMILDDLGFIATVHRFVNQMRAENSDLEIRCKIDGQEVKLLPVVSMVLFRVIQESCNNVKKYAQADMLDIYIVFREKEIGLSIIDNGVGFDTASYYNKKKEKNFGDIEEASKKGNLGISIMEERVQLLSGVFSIKSKLGEGTKVEVWIPVKEDN